MSVSKKSCVDFKSLPQLIRTANPSDILQPVFCLCSDSKEDQSWTASLVRNLHKAGMKNVRTTFDFTLGESLVNELKRHLQISRRLIIVLSKFSNKIFNFSFDDIIQMSVAFIKSENPPCRVIPVLLTEDARFPLVLIHMIPFCAWRDNNEKLLKAIFFEENEELLNLFVYQILQNHQLEQRLRYVNKCTLPPAPCYPTYAKRYGADVLDWWGIKIVEKQLFVNMRKLQIIALDQQIPLNDLFSGIFLFDEVEIVRLTGFENFCYKTFERQTHIFNDLVNLFIATFNEAKRRHPMEKLWYHYRRHGTTQTNMATTPMAKAITCVYSEELHSPELRNEESRLETFKHFPLKSPAFHLKLARAGLFYFGFLDYVQCFCCGNCMRTWSLNRNPTTRHMHFFFHCPYIQKLYNESKTDNTDVDEAIIDAQEGNVKQDYNEIYRDFETRFASFENLKSQNDIEETVLKHCAEDGFLYFGIKEDIICYSCNVGLSEIYKTKNPWRVHLNFLSTCPHIRRNEDKLKDLNEDGNDDCCGTIYGN